MWVASCAWFRHPDDAPVADLADLWVTRLLGSEMSSTTCSNAHLRPSTCSDAHSLSRVGELYKNAEAVQKMARLIGVDAPLGKAVLCPLPGHEESEPSAAIDPKSFVFRDFHERGERSWHTLQEVYASLRYGEVRYFKPGSLEAGVWAAGLAFDAGLLDVSRPFAS